MAGELANNIVDTALVFEGGGMRASYTSGALTVLLDEGIYFDWVGGISAGSSNTCNYVSRDSERARRSFVDFAADPDFGDLRTLARGQGVFNARYIYEESGLPGGPLEFDMDSFRANPARVRIGSFACQSGESVYWSNHDLRTIADLMIRVRASSTMPVVMPITTVDGVDHVDGALGHSGGVPLDAAQADGYTKFVMLLTRDRGYRKKPPRSVALYRRYFRQYPKVAEAIANRWRHYNRTRDEVLALQAAGKAWVFFPEELRVGNSERRIDRLQASFDAGRAQMLRDLPSLKRFLGC